MRWAVEAWRYNETAPLRPAWCPLGGGGGGDGACALLLPRGGGRVVLDNVRHNSLTHVHTNVSQGLFLRVVAQTADGASSSTFTPLGDRGLAGATGLVASARVLLHVHANRSVTMESDAVVPHAWLRLRPAKSAARSPPSPRGGYEAEGRFSRNSLLLLPRQPVTVDLLPLPGRDDAAMTITASEMQERLTVDCFNRVGGCSVTNRVAL